MKAIITLFPVFFIMGLGWLSGKFNMITPEQSSGAKRIVFDVLFPFLIYTVLVQCDLEPHFITQILFLDAAWIAIYLLGATFIKSQHSRFGHIMPFLLLTCEGGSVALPLYITLAGQEHAVNIITFDVAGILINFGLLPAIVTKKVSGEVRILPLLKRIFTSPFMIAVILGIIANLTGLHQSLLATPWGEVFKNTSLAVSAPISTIILFTLGFEFRLNKVMISAITRLAFLRLLLCSLIVGLFFLIFPQLMGDHFFLIAVLLYFICPTGFPVPFQIEPLCKNQDDEHFMSAFISFFILLALIGYTLITIYLL